MQRQVILHLVEGDDAPALPVRFTDLDLADYSVIEMKIELGTTKARFSRDVVPDGTDEELGYVTWQTGDLVEGDHLAEFEFTRASDSKKFTLPQRFPVILRVRKDLG